MPLKFTKMHGIGNDYVFVSTFDQVVEQPEELAARISDRHRGVGGDGLILVAPPDGDDADVRMLIYNADGSRAQMCGNGIRCVARLAYETGLARRNPIRVQSDRGVLTLDLELGPEERVESVRVDMGEPVLDPRQIPVTMDGTRIVGVPQWVGGHNQKMTCVSMGNPHAVFFVPDVTAVPLAVWGPSVENRPMFRDRINVHFAQVLTRNALKMITWERGSGITLACGTGAAAVCVSGVLNGLTDRKVVADLPGGTLELEWDEATNHVFMSGPAEAVFTGEWVQGT